MFNYVLLLVCVLLCIAAVAGISGAPWVPARKKDVDALLRKLGDVHEKTIIELGCGDGRFVVAAARQGAFVTGYEINPLLYAIAKIRSAQYKNATVKLRNFWLIDLSKADTVVAFLVPRTMPRIARKIEKEMKQNSTFASYVFPIKGRKSSGRTGSWFLYHNE